MPHVFFHLDTLRPVTARPDTSRPDTARPSLLRRLRHAQTTSALLLLATCATTLVPHNAFAADALTAPDYAALIDAKNYQAVETAIATTLKTDPTDATALVAQVDLILQQADAAHYDEAVSHAELCIQHHPDHGACHEALGNVLGVKAEQGGMMEGIGALGTIRDSFETAIKLDPANVNANVSLMTFYLEVPGLLGGSSRSAKKLLRAAVTPELAALLQAKLQINNEKLQDASNTLLGIAATSDPAILRQQRDILLEIGQSQLQKPELAAAQHTYQAVIERHPTSAGAYFGLGRVLLAQGKASEALAPLQQALNLDASAAVHYRLGKTWQALGDKDKAIAAYQSALAFTPALSEKTRADAQTQLAQLQQ